MKQGQPYRAGDGRLEVPVPNGCVFNVAELLTQILLEEVEAAELHPIASSGDHMVDVDLLTERTISDNGRKVLDTQIDGR